MPVSKVDLDKCVGCGTCVESCPMDVFRLDTVVEYRQERSPCSLACPLGLRQREYHDLLQMGMLDEAVEVLRRCHPMPAITGRLCPHPCESECTRSRVDEAVNINALEQFLGDHLLAKERAATTPATVLTGAEGSEGQAGVSGWGRPARVAIVGSGPAGLAAAYFLVLGGFEAVVFEKDEKPGGLLRTAIPAFRLPEDVLDAQIDFFRSMGISFRTGVRVGMDLSVQDLRGQGFAAVIGATGAAKPMGLSVPGSDATGIVSAMEFLAKAKLAAPRLSGAVAVVGGGSVALDAARTAVRLGAERVSVICLERLEPGLKDSMPALTAEIDDGLAEGVRIHPSRGVDSFVTIGGRVSAVRCVECLSVRDEDGRFAPVYGDCVLPEAIEAQTVILAIGQVADPTLVPAGFATDVLGLIGVDAAGLRRTGLWAAGDAVSGASTVVEALAAGKKAAEVVARYLRGEELDVESTGDAIVAAVPPEEKVEEIPRKERRCRPWDERRRDFRETWLAFDRLQAQGEAERCLTCGSRSRIAYLDDCQVCRLCQKYCPTDAIEITEGALLGSLHGWNVVELGR
jgi:NADPH-dependent glutamate synthase beta subunit-like oxidoreductase